MKIIEVKDLSKNYKVNIKKEGLRGSIYNILNPKYITKEAVKNINFSINEGEIVGYIGANGAGKSTTIKMLTGILTPSSGDVIVDGIVPYKNRLQNNKKIGVVFGQRSQLWWDIPVIESLQLIKKIYEVPEDSFQENLKKFSEILELDELLNIPVRQLSLGQKMRCEIAAVFIHNPQIVYLDEPTIGLDVLVKERIRKFIKSINVEKKVTVLLTTHDLDDIEELCKRIIIIDKGMIIYDGGIKEIKEKYGTEKAVSFKVKHLKEKPSIIFANENFQIEVDEDRQIEEINEIIVTYEIEKYNIVEIMSKLSPYCEIIDMSITDVSIEDIVKHLFGKREL